MKTKAVALKIHWMMILMIGLVMNSSSLARAHCDTMDGPVVLAEQSY